MTTDTENATSLGASPLERGVSRRGGIAPPAHTRGEHTTDSWITPRWLIDRLGPFDLDPCQCDPQPWPCAATGYTENGLMLPWHGLVWCNPPYGKSMKAWLNKLALHGNGIALVFARTETEAFFGHAWPYASAMLFLRGRLTFAYPDGSLPRNGANSGGPSVLIGYGDEAERPLLRCSDLGAVVKRVTTANVAGNRLARQGQVRLSGLFGPCVRSEPVRTADMLRTCEDGCNGCDECTDWDEPAA